MQARDRREPVLVHVEAKDLVFAPRPRSHLEARSREHERTRAANAFAWRIGLAVGAGVLVALLLFNVFERRQAARDVAAITAAMETELAKGQRDLERQLAALSRPETVRTTARSVPEVHPCVAEPWRCQAPAARAAQTASTCVKRGEPTLFTSGPCPPGWRAAREVAYVPEPAVPQRPIARPQPRQAQRSVVLQDTGSNYTRARSRCEAAKAHRDATLRRVGLRRTYDLLQQLDAHVYEACK